MKQLKFWMVAFTLLMGVSFTSCLDSNEGEVYDIPGWAMLVNSYMGYVTFKDAEGNTYTPTQASLTQFETENKVKISDYKMGFVIGKRIEPETGAKTTDITFALKAFQPITYANAVVAPTKEDLDTAAPENSPVRTLSGEGVQPVLFNKDILVFFISWRLQNDIEKFKLHKLALACALDEIEEGDTELVFYVRHDNGGDDKSDVYYTDWYAYDIQYALHSFEAKTGKLPTKLVIKAHETGDYGTNEMPTAYTDYTVEYKVASAN